MEGGLSLVIRPGGTKIWRLSYRHAGKQSSFTLGRFPDLSLAEARRRRDVFKGHLEQGAHPTR